MRYGDDRAWAWVMWWDGGKDTKRNGIASTGGTGTSGGSTGDPCVHLGSKLHPQILGKWALEAPAGQRGNSPV